MTRSIFILILLLQAISSHAAEKTADSLAIQKANFYAAKQKIEAMLDGQEPLSYERAIFLIENAYWNNALDEKQFKASLDLHTRNIVTLAKQNLSKLKYDYNPQTIFENVRERKEEYIKAKQRLYLNWAIFSYLMDAPVLKQENNKWNINHVHRFKYSYTDPLGTNDWSNTQVVNLLDTKQGNCFALASLFKILSDRLNTGAILCTAPGHIYISHKDEKGSPYNVELSNGSFPGDGTIETITHTTVQATISNIALRNLDQKQSIALCLVYLAEGYQYKFNIKDDPFMLQCAEDVLRYDDHSLNAVLLKAEILEESLLKKNKSLAQLQSTKVFSQYQQLINQLFKYGYREMPLEMKNLLVKHWSKDSTTFIQRQEHVPAQFNHTGMPNTRYASLSWGAFDEEIHDKPIERYGRTLFDTKKQRITGFDGGQTLYNDYNFDPVAFAWSVDPLAHKFPWQSPYTAFGDDPINNIDLGGAFQYPAKLAASYAQQYQMITKYLAEYIQHDVMKSPTIIQAMSKYSEGNLTPAQIKSDTKWGNKASPSIVISEGYKVSEDGKAGVFAEYTSYNNTINVSKGFADRIEGVLAGNGSNEDKQAALYEFFGTITHEEVHRGDYLDGKRQENTDASGWGGEPGTAFMQDVFESVKIDAGGGNKTRTTIGASIHEDSKDLIQQKKSSGEGDVVPTVPNK